ncbi:SCO2322 family protein [Streptomyces sp. MZ04]|uniref:SCO2322 family protein n=1 Tax=Streptomyces sp. MZ04 TaxID=2559236 RepID=UPI001FD76535|nr:SCO2322 family protein [Streptomyces sp. MZ04]
MFAVLAAAPAQAAGYRYWSFWDRDGAKWAYATQGPSTARPDDGAVQGFRFSVSEDSQDSAKPRGPADFGTICAKTPAEDGKKRVALVIDFGTAQDAPDGETPPKPRTACARVADDATSADALAAVAKPLRYDSNALLCAIADYPKSGCGEQVSGNGQSEKKPTTGESAQGKKDASDGGPSVGLIAGVAAIAVLGASAVWQARRRRG